MSLVKKGMHIGAYEILDIIPGGNEGGMAEVYHAYCEARREEVAIKISKSKKDDALKKEGDLLRMFNHPSVIRILPLQTDGRLSYYERAIELDGEPWFYTMEYIPGGSLYGLIQKVGRLPFDLSCAIASKIIDGVEYIHNLGIAHLDIKPENVLFKVPPIEENVIFPVLIDFGIAAKSKNVNIYGGSLAYMAPEQLMKVRGDAPPERVLDNNKMDIYSLGAMVYLMWTGKYPYGNIKSGAFANSILHGSIQPPRVWVPEIPVDADQFMVRWLAREPESRPQLAEMKNRINTWSMDIRRFPPIQANKKKPGWKFW